MATPNRRVFHEMRKWPPVEIPNKQTTHINVHKPKYWSQLAMQEGYTILDKWFAEHITYLRYASIILKKSSKKLHIDLRTTPVVRQTQQASCMALSLSEKSNAGYNREIKPTWVG